MRSDEPRFSLHLALVILLAVTACGPEDPPDKLGPDMSTPTPDMGFAEDMGVDSASAEPDMDVASPRCGKDERVSGGACVECPTGTRNDAGDDSAGADTSCDSVLCAADERVETNECVACPAGSSNMAGDDASAMDTQCDGIMCPSNQRVANNACVECPVGTTNMAGDDASGQDTTCDPVLCARDERVQDNACIACPVGTTNIAGDDASGADTICEDACSQTLGVYCFEITEGYLKASNSDDNDTFGESVSLSGDRLAVGAPREGSCATGVDPFGGQLENSCDNAGAVYIFERDPVTDEWTQTAYIKASNTNRLDQFGYSVSLSGDRLAVGAFNETSCADGVDPAGGQSDNSCRLAGAAYIFDLDAATNTWVQSAYVKASNSESEDWFSIVSLSGDRLAVGAYRENSCADGVDPDGGQLDNACDSAGATYIFERDAATDTWSQTSYLKASNSDSGDLFGISLSLDGDRLAVGAQAEDSCADGVNATGQADNSCARAGAVYLFEFNSATSNWAQIAYIKASNPDPTDNFGRTVSLSGDRLAVGASGEDSCSNGVNPPNGEADNNCGFFAGAAYVFELDAATGTWTQSAYLKASNSSERDQFGWRVALLGDRLAVTANREESCAVGVNPRPGQNDDSCDSAGAVYLFEFDTILDRWSPSLYFKASNTDVGDFFGGNVALSAGNLAVGAHAEDSCADGVNPSGGQADNACDFAGAIYTFTLAP